MNILITGGTGFIGSHLIHRLYSQKHNIFLIKRFSSNTWRIKDIEKYIQMFTVVKLENLPSIFNHQKFDLILHLAMLHKKEPVSWGDVLEMNYVNITLPSIILNLAAKYKTPFFINTGTCFEYKLSKNKIDEDNRIQPYDYYASTKVSFEEILKYHILSGKIKGLTLKLFYPYGEKNITKVISLMVQSLVKENALELTLGEQRLGYTYVDDIVEAYIKAIEYIQSKKYQGYEIFNIGADKVYSLKEIGKILSRISKKSNKFLFTKSYSPNEIMFMAASNKKAKRLLKWYPKTDMIEGLTKMFNYHKKYD